MRGDALVRFGEDSAYTDLVDWWKVLLYILNMLF